MGGSDPLFDSTVAAPGAAAAAVAWRYGGELHVTVIAKASFAFAADAPVQRVEPQPILRADVHHLNNPARSVRFTSDLVVYMQRIDVLFTGHAHAAGGTARAQTGRLVLYRDAEPVLDKRILVADSRGFQRIPIMYERAYGGIGFLDNPFGVGAGSASAGEPNILHATSPTVPSGFAPIAKSWPSRRAMRGSAPKKALEGPIADVPDDFEWLYFQSAPPDQQIESLRGDEWIVLEGLHPTLPIARMQLPNATAEARVYGLGAAGTPDGSPLELHIDTVRIDGDEQVVTLVFRGSFTVPDDDALRAVRFVAGVGTPDQPIRMPDPNAVFILSDEDLISVDEPAGAGPLHGGHATAIHHLGGTFTGESTGDDPSPVLPFRPSAHPSPILAAPRRPQPPPPRRDEDQTALFTTGGNGAAKKEALPWGPGQPPPPAAAPPSDKAPPSQVPSSLAPSSQAPSSQAPSLPQAAAPPEKAPSPQAASPAPSEKKASPWAEPPPEQPAAPKRKVPVPKPGVPGASPVIKQKLYGRFPPA